MCAQFFEKKIRKLNVNFITHTFIVADKRLNEKVIIFRDRI